MDILLILILVVLSFILVFLVLVFSKQSALVKSHRALNVSMQELSDQMSDLEERSVENQNDVRKLTQHFVNFARGTNKGVGSAPRWDV